MTTTTSTISETILAQLGGSRFIAMTGAKNLGYTFNSLSCQIGKNAKRVTHLRISLRSDDTYTVETFKLSGSIQWSRGVDGVYADQLRQVVEAETGLYLSL